MVSQRRDDRPPPASGQVQPIEEETVMQPSAQREQLWHEDGAQLPTTAPHAVGAFPEPHPADSPDQTVLLPANFAPRPIVPAAPPTAPFHAGAPSSGRLPLPPLAPEPPRMADATGPAPLPAWVWIYVFGAALLAFAGVIILLAEARVLGHL